MQVITTTDQNECHAILDMLGIRENFKPIPPHVVSDSLLEIADGVWLVGTNDRGHYTLHALVGSTQADAWRFLEVIRGEDRNFKNLRCEFVGATPQSTARN